MMKKKAFSLALAVLMLFSVMTGCQKKEAPVAADAVAEALFQMILKNDASSAVELFGYASEEDARKDMGLDGDLYDEMAKEVVSQFSAMGITASTEDVQTFIDAFGEEGRHARSAIGTNSLPLGLTVEVESIFEIE